jgi:hypothetical protein
MPPRGLRTDQAAIPAERVERHSAAPDAATHSRLRFEAAEKRQQTEAQSAVDTVLAKL